MDTINQDDKYIIKMSLSKGKRYALYFGMAITFIGALSCIITASIPKIEINYGIKTIGVLLSSFLALFFAALLLTDILLANTIAKDSKMNTCTEDNSIENAVSKETLLNN